MFDHLVFRHCTWDQKPDLDRVAVWVDPAVTNKDDSDAHGIQADGIAGDGTIYRLFSWEDRTTPRDAITRAIRKAIELGARNVGVETDQGGDTWEDTFDRAAEDLVKSGEFTRQQMPGFESDKAGAGHGPKVQRAAQMLASYERGEIVHVVGTHDTLERALRRFPKTKPFDLVDASFWSWNDLANNTVPTAAPTGMIQRSTWR
jgi:phage terminase large subunit-like protein